MIKRLDLENASVNELLVLTEMLIDVLVDCDVDHCLLGVDITVFNQHIDQHFSEHQ